MYKKVMMLSLIFIGCSSSVNVEAKPKFKLNNSIKKHLEKDKLLEHKSSYFYINIMDIDKAKQADSITYFYTNDNPSHEIENYFLEFAKEIGDKHGAVIISPNTNIRKAFQLINKVSSCEVIEPILYPVIVFEDKRKNECYPLYIQEVNYGTLVKVLSIIQKSINNKNNIDKEQFTHNTKYSVKAVLDEYPTIKTFEIGIFKFIDYLGDKIYS